MSRKRKIAAGTALVVAAMLSLAAPASASDNCVGVCDDVTVSATVSPTVNVSPDVG